MTLNQLIENNTWKNVSSILIEIYPKAEKNKQVYQLVFEKLKKINPEQIDISIVITKEIDEDEEYIDVSGILKHPKSDDEKYPQGIEFCSWCQWLGMDINKDSFIDFSEEEIIAHCLYEMTFISFSEEDIQKAHSRLKTKD
jgi:hypothetical protein